MYKELQNGSDIRGVALPNDKGEAVNLTKVQVRTLAAAYAIWLSKKLDKDVLRLAVGHDSRLTSVEFKDATIEGWNAAEITDIIVDVYDTGLASTPAMFMSTVLDPYRFDGSIMITASHLPSHRNGMKFFTKDGGLEHEEIAEITEIAETLDISVPADMEAKKIDFMDVYTAYLRKKIKGGVSAADFEKPLAGLHIIVDAGNGDGGFFVDRVLKELGADTTGSQFLEPDGNFPNHIPNPENAEAAESIRRATLENHADLGIIFDTDVDRAGAVLPDGTTLTRNALIAVLARIALNEHPGTTIVTDSVTSTGLAEFIKAHGGVHRRFKRGYKNVIDESIRLNNEGTDSQLAIETSGHGAWKENYFLDDGAYLMVKLLIEMGKGAKLSDMIADLKEPEEGVEIRFPVTAQELQPSMDKVLDTLEKAATATDGWSLEKENFEGIRINTDKDHGNGWLLLRKSLHEPIMPLNIESDSEGGCKVMATVLLAILKDAEGLDLSPLEKFVADEKDF